MEYELSQKWIDTFSKKDWDNACIHQYWEELFNLNGKRLWSPEGWNTAVLTKHNIQKDDLKRSLMFLTNTIVSDNPYPAFWALRHTQYLFKDLHTTEFTHALEFFANKKHALFSELIKCGGGVKEFNAAYQTLKRMKRTDLLGDVLLYFPLEGKAAQEYQELRGWEKPLTESVGIEDQVLMDPSTHPTLNLDWLFTPHIQMHFTKSSVFETVWRIVAQNYPDPRVLVAAKRMLDTANSSPAAIHALVDEIFDCPIENQSIDFLAEVAQTENWMPQFASSVMKKHWLFDGKEKDVLIKFFSLIPETMFEAWFDDFCAHAPSTHDILKQTESLCGWVQSSRHPNITKKALLKHCQLHPNLYNNLQNMVLISEIHSEQKPKNRKM